MTKKLLVYTDWRVFFSKKYWTSIDIPMRITNDINEFLNSNEDYKVVITSNHTLFPENAVNRSHEVYINYLKEIALKCDLVFANEYELHSETLFLHTSGVNVYWAIPGLINSDYETNIIFNGSRFNSLNSLYDQLPDKLANLNPYTPKEKLFDALLGLEKPHRTFVYDSLHNNNLEELSIISYAGKTKVWIDEPDVITNQDKNTVQNSYDGVSYGHLHDVPWSHIVPISLYNKTAYSIIAETNYFNEFSFYTEKTGKVFLGKRLFVPFCGYRFLSNLRKVGFKTFDGIIDESFDEIQDDNTRWNAAFDQILKLSKMNQQEVLDLAKPILEHNYNHFVQTNWFESTVSQIVNKVKDLTLTS